MEREELLDRLDGIFMRIGRRFRHRMQDENLTLGQFALMRLLFHDGPLAMGEIADRLSVSVAAATGLVDRMIHARLVERQRSENDRRVVLVDLSPHGRERMVELRDSRRQHMAAMLQPLSTEDLEQLLRLWQEVADGVDRDAN